MSDIRPKAAAELVRTGIETLSVEDPGLFELLENEIRRQRDVLAMVAASSIAPPSVLACEGLATTNVTAEG